MAESPPPTKDRRTFAAKQASAEEWHDFERIRLAIAEDQLRDVIVDQYLDFSALPFDLGFTPDFRLRGQIEPELLASSILANSRFRFWIGVLGGHGPAFLQETEAGEHQQPTHQSAPAGSQPRAARGTPSGPLASPASQA
jgi:hypothetical protein